MTMGRQHLVDKTIRPLTTLTSITPAGVISNVSQAGVIPIGNYKGVPAFWDLDKAVNQPLVNAEDRYIQSMLDGRLAGYDFAAATFLAADAITLQRRARITVPAGQVWYVSAVQIYVPKDTTCTFDVNWRCSLWTDPATAPDADGQTFLAGDGVGTNAINIWDYLLGVAPATTNIGIGVVAGTNLGLAIGTPKTLAAPLRLKGGDWITLQATVRTNVVVLATVLVLIGVTGYVAKPLVA